MCDGLSVGSSSRLPVAVPPAALPYIMHSHACSSHMKIPLENTSLYIEGMHTKHAIQVLFCMEKLTNCQASFRFFCQALAPVTSGVGKKLEQYVRLLSAAAGGFEVSLQQFQSTLISHSKGDL